MIYTEASYKMKQRKRRKKNKTDKEKPKPKTKTKGGRTSMLYICLRYVSYLNDICFVFE